VQLNARMSGTEIAYDNALLAIRTAHSRTSRGRALPKTQTRV